jgi:outer membrane protein assembly factor BamA
MKCLFATFLASTVLLFPHERAVAFENTSSINVNSRYRIERISIQSGSLAVPQALQRELDRLVGRPYRTQTMDALERRIRSEFPGFAISRKVAKGEKQDQIRVQFVLERSRKYLDFNLPRMTFHSEQNFTFAATADLNLRSTSTSFGFISDNDERVERFDGFRGAFIAPLAKNLRIAFLAEAYQSEFEEPSSEFYHSRTNFEPTLIYTLAPGLELRGGFSFNNFEFQVPAVRNQAAHAVITTLRYSKQWQLGLASTQKLEAGYSLRAAARFLGSDFHYRRHLGEARLTFASGNSEKPKATLAFSSMIGAIDGRAPVLDRFVLGNTKTLRGWNRHDIAPLGADRVIHFSADGRYRFVRAVYDTGTVWNAGRPKVLRHSAGLGFVVSGITAMVAIPMRSSSIEPIFMVGMNF